MNIFPNVTKADTIELVKLSEQQKRQKANEIENRSLKPTHKEHLTETFKPITEKLCETTEATEKRPCSKTQNETRSILERTDSQSQTPEKNNSLWKVI